MKFRVLPFVWLTFSGGGVIAAVFLPILVILLAFALPLGWVDPSHQHLEGVVESWFTRLVLFALMVPMLVHAAHRFRYTVYDGLQVKQKFLVAPCATAARSPCHGGVLRAGDRLEVRSLHLGGVRVDHQRRGVHGHERRRRDGLELLDQP